MTSRKPYSINYDNINRALNSNQSRSTSCISIDDYITNNHLTPTSIFTTPTSIFATPTHHTDHFKYPSVKFYGWNLKSLLNQLLIGSTAIYLFWNQIFIINLLTVDSIFTSLVYIGQLYGFQVEQIIYHNSTSQRYIYYLFLIAAHYNFTYLLWIDSIWITKSILLILTMPSIIEKFINCTPIHKYHIQLVNRFICIIKMVACKRLSKSINNISTKYLNNDPQINAQELYEIVNNVTIGNIAAFSGSCFIASLLYYFELNGTNVCTAFFRQYCFGQYILPSAECYLDDHQYVNHIVSNRLWHKLNDAYTINRFLQCYIKINEKSNGGILGSDVGIQTLIGYSIKRFMIAWTGYSLIKMQGSGVLCYSFLLFNDRHYRLLIKLLIMSIYFVITIISNEQVLFLLLMELTIVASNNLSLDLIMDISKSIKKELPNSIISKNYIITVIMHWSISILLEYLNLNWAPIVLFICPLFYRLYFLDRRPTRLILSQLLLLLSFRSQLNIYHLMIINLNTDILYLY